MQNGSKATYRLDGEDVRVGKSRLKVKIVKSGVGQCRTEPDGPGQPEPQFWIPKMPSKSRNIRLAGTC